MGPCRIADLHRRARRQIVNRLVASGRRQNHERIPAKHTLDDNAGTGFQKTHIAAAALVYHAKIAAIMPERADGERHQDRLVEQQRDDDEKPDHTGEIVVAYRDRYEDRAKSDGHDDDPIDHDAPKSAIKSSVERRHDRPKPVELASLMRRRE